MLVRLVAILILFLGLAMWAAGEGPEKDRVAQAQARLIEQRDSALNITLATFKVEQPPKKAANIDTVNIEDAPQTANASLVTPAPAVVAPAQPSEPVETTNAPVAEPESEVIELYVTGRRVNLRAGPSTTQSVIGKVTRGQKVELLDFVEDGWAKIRVDGIDQAAYMAGNFLADSQ